MVVTYGYLERPYLIDSYLSGVSTVPVNSQISRRIVKDNVIHVQFDRRVATDKHVKAQFNRKIFDKKQNVGAQILRRVQTLLATRSQFNRQIVTSKAVKTQIDRRVGIFKSIHVQFNRMVKNSASIHVSIQRMIFKKNAIHLQFSRTLVAQSKVLHVSIKSGNISHQICGGYLVGPYLMESYLARNICAHLKSQYDRRIVTGKAIHVQVDRKTQALKTIHAEYDRQIKALRSIHMQFTQQTATLVHVQFLRAIYNTDLLRVLWQFPSRGMTGLNWTVVAGGQMAGDFSINNVNTDIVEQVYRSTSKSITIQSDTQVTQGVFVDTMAILNHNLTTSAQVQFQGSQDPAFSSIGFSTPVPVTRDNIYWIAPVLPTQSFRYWRIVATDPTNDSFYLELGTILFGSALIFNLESFVDEVQKRKVHFADRVRTAGFSNVSNDRALKNAFTISFRRLNYNFQNYKNLTDVIDYVRTSLKALWIPTPQFPERFACFGKLQEIPSENHKVISKQEDYIDFDINVDESL